MGLTSALSYGFDAEAGVTLRAVGGGTIVTTTASTALALGTNSTAFWTLSDTPHLELAIVIFVESTDDTTMNETYQFDVEVDTTVGFASAVAVASVVVPAAGAPGFYSVTVSGKTIEKFEPGATHIRLNAVLGGTTPILAYGAWLAPSL